MDDMTELAHLKSDLIGKVRETTDKAIAYTQNFMEYRHLWTDDRKVRGRSASAASPREFVLIVLWILLFSRYNFFKSIFRTGIHEAIVSHYHQHFNLRRLKFMASFKVLH